MDKSNNPDNPETYPDILPFVDEEEFFSSEIWPIFMAFLIGPLVGISIAAFKWGIPKITEFLISLPYNQTLIFASTLIAGSLLMGILLNFAPLISGPGISDAALTIVDQKGQGPWYWWPFKVLSTILCVAPGGGGLVGPSFFTGMAAGIFCSHLLGFKEKAKRQTMALLGAGAGVGAILLAPIGGTLVGVEALAYKRGQGQLALCHTVAALLTSLIAFLTTGILTGFEPILSLGGPLPSINSVSVLLHVLLAALVGAIIAKFYVGIFRNIGKLWKNWAPLWLRPALGALLVIEHFRQSEGLC